MPHRATEGSAGYDLCACLETDLALAPGAHCLIPTGISVTPESADWGGFVFARSGLAIRHHITLSNSVGVIDSDYTGEVCVGLVNLGQEAYVFHDGDRIAQLCFLPVASAQFELAEDLPDSERGEGGFGSSGR